MEPTEIHQPHVRHGGGLPRWLELIIAVTALITSVSSIALAVHNGRVMERLVEANSIPYMQGGFSDVTPDGKAVLSLDLLNRGVGPAHEESLHVRVGNTYVKTSQELFAAALGREQEAKAEAVLHPLWNRVATRFVPGGQSQMVFRIERTAENAQYWDLLKQDAFSRWYVEYCYCSVFQDCWEVHGVWSEPAHVKQCHRDESREFIP